MITLNDTTLLQTNKIRLKNIYVSTYTTQLTLVVLQPCDFYTQKPGYFQHVSHVISQPAREFLQNILIYFQIHLINYLLWHGGLEQIKYDSYASIILTMNLKFQSLLPNVDLMYVLIRMQECNWPTWGLGRLSETQLQLNYMAFRFKW